MPDVLELRQHYKLPPLLGKLFHLLMTNPLVTNDMVEKDAELTHDIAAAFFRLRRRLDVQGITIHSQRDLGYWIEPEDKAKVREFLQEGSDK